MAMEATNVTVTCAPRIERHLEDITPFARYIRHDCAPDVGALNASKQVAHAVAQERVNA